jgi:hypothetical protein
MILAGKNRIWLPIAIGLLMACHAGKNPSIDNVSLSSQTAPVLLEDPSLTLAQLLCQAKELRNARFELVDSLTIVDKDPMAYTLLMERGNVLKQQSEALANQIKEIQKVYYQYWENSSYAVDADSILFHILRDRCP